MSACSVGDLGSILGSGRSPGEGKWQPTPIFLPGTSHEQRSLAGYSPWGLKRVRHNWATSLMDFVGQKLARSLAPSCIFMSLMRLQLDTGWICILLKTWLGLQGPLLKWHTLVTCKLVLVIGGGPSPPGSLHMAWVCAKHGNWIIKANKLRTNEGMERERRYLTSSKQKLYAF